MMRPRPAGGYPDDCIDGIIFGENAIPDSTIEKVRRLFRHVGLVEDIENRMRTQALQARTALNAQRADKGLPLLPADPGGRPRTDLTVEALLVAMLLTAGEPGGIMQCTHWATLLHSRLSDQARASLGVTRDRLTRPTATQSQAQKQAATRARRSAVKQVERLFHAIIRAYDPSALPKNRLLADDEFTALIKPLTAQQQADMEAALLRICNRLLEATFRSLPRAVRQAWAGDVVQDATFVQSFARGPRRSSGLSSTDPDAGYYVRDDDHKAPADSREARRKNGGKPVYKYGFEVEILIAASHDADIARRYPNLILSMDVHAPGHGPAGSSINMLTDLATRHENVNSATGEITLDPHHPDGKLAARHPVGCIAADRAYSQVTATNWAIPLTQLGYQPVFDYKRPDLGLQGQYAGAYLVDGTWYSPAIPKPLIDATADYVDSKIDHDLWQKRLDARISYELRPGTRPDPNGTMRWHCPASGVTNTNRPPLARCDRKPASMPATGREDDRIIMLPVTVAGAIPKVCQQQTITIPGDTHARHRQHLRHGTPEWQTVYSTLRNTVEGANGVLKAGARTNLADASKRRIRGIAATMLMTAFLLAAANLTKISDFLERADHHEDGGMFIRAARKKRAAKRTPTDRPAGATRPANREPAGRQGSSGPHLAAPPG